MSAPKPQFRERHFEEEKFGRYFIVVKDGVKLSYSASLEAAKRHADNCGGEVYVGKTKVWP